MVRSHAYLQPCSRGFPVWMLAAALAGCAPPLEPVGPLPEGRGGDADCGSPPPGSSVGRMLRVDGAGSRLHIRVYRGGRLAHLGHNHLVAAGELQGHALMTPEGPGSRFVLCIPVQSLQVDDAELRAAAGPEFSDPVPAAAAEATRDNMLGPSQLNGSRYPHIVVTGRVGDGAYPKFRVELQLAVRDKVHAVAATVGLEPFQGGLDAAGRLRVRLTDLGIEPYTALFGALAVKDELRIDYRVRALD